MRTHWTVVLDDNYHHVLLIIKMVPHRSFCFNLSTICISTLCPPAPSSSIPGFSPSHSLNRLSSKAQGVSREFVQLWQGRAVFPQRSLKSDRLSTLGLSAGLLSSGCSSTGSAVRLGSITIWSQTHTYNVQTLTCMHMHSKSEKHVLLNTNACKEDTHKFTNHTPRKTFARKM